MKALRNIAAAAAICAVLAACNREIAREEGEGALSLRIETLSKAAMTESELLSSASVSIYKADFSGLVRHYSYAEMPASIFLPADSYRIDVAAGELVKDNPAVASWEQKSYKGSKEIRISSGSKTTETIEARICNVISKISFDASVSEMFEPGFTCTVGLSSSDASSQLVYDAASGGKDGYFIASGFEPSLYWRFKGTLSKSGESIEKSGQIAAVEGGKRYTMSLKYTEKDGILSFDIIVDDSTNDIYNDIIFVPVSTGIATSSRFEVWAGHFTAHADVDEDEYDPSKVYFEFRAAADVNGNWTRVDGTRESEGSYSAVFTGLSPETEYEYRLVVTVASSLEEETIAAPSTFTTEVARQAPNSSFETVSNAESSKYYSLYDPQNALTELQTKWWCSGNAGSTMVGSSAVICYPDTGDYKDGSQSMCLQSRYVIVKFAAGNLFSGHFGETIGTKGGTVFFGRPFTARPTALRLWVKYSGGAINRIESNAPSEVKEGDYDKASLKVALGTWDYKKYGGDPDSPILVNTTDETTFVDFNTDEATIAYGEHYLASDADNSSNSWQQLTIPLTYRNLNSYPTHIVIAFAASMYGDYFTGYDNSKLWVDKVELLYE
ncbi:MAG: PCMD domain-containing protein [Bacteroidales bacterium]|nr:PCMD domain-containing protein [Bacteroidales bacterium]